MIFVWFGILCFTVFPLVDVLREKATYGKVHNINHWIGYGIAFVAAVILYALYDSIHITSWHTFLLTLLHLAITGIAFGSVRGIVFDPAINILFNLIVKPRAIDYISAGSNALNEDRLTHVGFWWRRLWYTLLTAGSITAYYLL
jgi:hypothetical protein